MYNNLKQNSVLFDSFVPEFNANYPIEKYFDMEHFKEVYKELISLSKKSKVKIRFSPKFEYSNDPLLKIEEFFNTPADKPVSEIYKPCMYPYSNMMITPSGDVYPCLSQKIGNVKDMKIKEVKRDIAKINTVLTERKIAESKKDKPRFISFSF